MKKRIKSSNIAPESILNRDYAYASFKDGKVFPEKKTGRLPAMGWNSWNAFGSGNTEALTREMAARIKALELDKLGYEYLVLDDGCYLPERVNGRVQNEPNKFPSGFRKLSDDLHAMGLKFGMYNDVGTNLCAGAHVGTCGFEDVDAETYASWNIDFLKVDNCYYPWDNATFSNPENARYTYAPNIRGICLRGAGYEKTLSADDGELTGRGAVRHANGYVTNIGIFDGTNVGNTPVGEQACGLIFAVTLPESGEYALTVDYATGREAGVGAWLQVCVDGEGYAFDEFLPETESAEDFHISPEISLVLTAGEHKIELCNHRRQENTLNSYAAMFYALQEKSKERDVVLSLCEWGKTMPHNWAYKMGDSWRILNDITFHVARDGDTGHADWERPGTDSITSQYDKAVIMDEFAGLKLGWNDPDMMVIGMDGITDEMARSHMAMWCMMNSPLMLGLDLRRVEKGDAIYEIIANRDLIALNQDPLGVQAKRIFCTMEADAPDKTYITNHDRVDILAKPLADGSVALLFQNLSQEEKCGDFAVTAEEIVARIGEKLPNAAAFKGASSYRVQDLWTKEVTTQDGRFAVERLSGCGQVTLRVTPNL